MFEVTFFLSQNIMVSKKIVVFRKVLSTLNVERQLRAGVSNLGGEAAVLLVSSRPQQRTVVALSTRTFGK